MQAVDEYLNALSAPQKADLERIRRIVLAVVPDAEEVISYGMPGFKYKGKYLVGFAAFKDHLSLFPTPGPIAALSDKLSSFRLAKGTIQFSPEHSIPESLLKEILQQRHNEITTG